MLLTNAISSGWRSSKIVASATANLRETLSGHVNGLHTKIDESSKELRDRIDNGLRDIDDKMDEHFRDDIANFATSRRETGEMGHSLREKITQVEFWNRDNFPSMKHFDEKIGHLVARLEQQDRVSDARHETSLANVEENRAAHADVVRRLGTIEQNGKH